MARRNAPRGGRGAKSRAQRIERLESTIGRKGIEAAHQLIREHDADVIRYAYLILPRPAAAGGLGARIESLLSKVDAGKAAEIRKTLLAAKEDQR